MNRHAITLLATAIFLIVPPGTPAAGPPPNLIYILADDLGNDVGEAHDLATDRPDIVAKMERLMAASRTDSPDFPLRKPRGKRP